MFWRKRKPSDIKAEVEAHVELETDRLKERGLRRRKREIGIRMALGCTTSQAMVACRSAGRTRLGPETRPGFDLSGSSIEDYPKCALRSRRL
jgi:hypothetical protein